MKEAEIIFNRIKFLLKKYFNEGINESSNEMYISIYGIYIGLNDRELVVGHGSIHCHYETENDSFNEGIKDFLNLIIKRKRVTEYLKGDYLFKRKIEIELSESNYEIFGIDADWLFPYWKKTTERIKFLDKLIDDPAIEKEIIKIKNCAQRPRV